VSDPFVPVPRAALRVVARAHRIAVLDLFDRGFDLGWEAFSFTERELSDEWGVSGRTVWSILEALQAAGWLEFTRAPTRTRQRSTVRVFRPTRGGEQQTGKQNEQQNEQQNRRGATPKTPEVAAERTADAAAEWAAPRAEKTRAREEQNEEQKEMERENARTREPSRPSTSHEEVLAVATALQCVQAVSDDPPIDLPKREQQAIRQAVRSGLVVAADIAVLHAWLVASPDSEAQFFRERRLGLGSICNDRVVERLKLARAWDTAGRPTGPPARAAPRGRARDRPSFMDQLREAVNDGDTDDETVIIDAGGG
jgi:DNA-binding PadR family transcriptional regulator